MLGDAFADAKGEVESRESGIAIFKAGSDAEGVEIVVEAQAVAAEHPVESLFSSVAEGGMADVVNQREGLGEERVETEGVGQSAGDLGYFKSVGEAASGVIAFSSAACEDLGLARQAAEGASVQDAADVALEGGAVRVRRFGVDSGGQWMARFAGDGDCGWKRERVEGGVIDLHGVPERGQIQAKLFA